MSIADKNCFVEKTGYNVREDMFRFSGRFEHPDRRTLRKQLANLKDYFLNGFRVKGLRLDTPGLHRVEICLPGIPFSKPNTLIYFC